MLLGSSITANENGDIVEESTVVIEDGATTYIRKNNHYEKGWEIR